MIPIPNSSATDRSEGRLLNLATLFLAFFCIALSLAPLLRTRSLDTPPAWSHWLAFFAWLVLFNLAHFFSVRRLPNRDPFLLPAAGLLTGWGLLTIYRLAPGFGLRQTGWMAVAMIIFIFGLGLSPDFRFLRRYKYLWLTSGLVLTALTLFLGTNPLGYGPRMWLGCCGVYLQPSEPLKLLLIIYLAAYLADALVIQNDPSAKTKALLPLLAPSLIMTGMALLLLIVQRDLGTASIFLFLYAVMVYVATGRRRVALIAVVVLGLASVAGYLLFDVVRVRVDAWLNPWLDPAGRSYQIVQSLIAVANGGIIGRGPGLGNPSLVPVAHSDFIFSAAFEEFGLIGAVALIGLIALLAGRALRAALRARDPFRRYLAVGLTAYLTGQSILIIAGNLRLLPLTGVTLPFVSYGGSSLLVSILSLLLLVLISSAAELPQKSIPRHVYREPKPILQLAMLLLGSLAVIAGIAGWWSLVRSSTLVARTDNARRSISDRYVRRGALLDRENRPVNQTEGTSGDYTRQTLYPDLSPITGYTDPVYGQSGLEASLDAYLRGVAGNPLAMIWATHLLYGQPPPGVDVRTSLDLDLQQTADTLLGDHKGALVLLNAQSGEILAMASHPTFNANRIAELGKDLTQNPNSPLLNRATQGMYPAGAALGPLLLADSGMVASGNNTGDRAQNPPSPPAGLSYTLGDKTLQCAGPAAEPTWAGLVGQGCPAPVAALGEKLGARTVRDLFDKAGLYTPPEIYLPTGSVAKQSTGDPAALALGEGLQASPLQMSLAAAAISAGGVRPAPYLVTAINEPDKGWVILPAHGNPERVLPAANASEAAVQLGVAGTSLWQSLAVAPQANQQVTWYLGGTQPGWKGTPLVLAVILEENNPALAEQIGQSLLQTATGNSK